MQRIASCLLLAACLGVAPAFSASPQAPLKIGLVIQDSCTIHTDSGAAPRIACRLSQPFRRSALPAPQQPQTKPALQQGWLIEF